MFSFPGMSKGGPVPSAPGLMGIGHPAAPSNPPGTPPNFSAGEAMSPISSGPIAPTMPAMKGSFGGAPFTPLISGGRGPFPNMRPNVDFKFGRAGANAGPMGNYDFGRLPVGMMERT